MSHAAAHELLALALAPHSGLRALEAAAEDASYKASRAGAVLATEARQAEALVDSRRGANEPPHKRRYD